MTTSLSPESLRARLLACGSWEAKNRLLVQLASELPALGEEARSEENLVSGCESRVWLKINWKDGRLELGVDSDSRIIKGLLTLVHVAYQGRSIMEIAEVDFDGWLADLGLGRTLTASRSNGLKAVVASIRTSAAAR